VRGGKSEHILHTLKNISTSDITSGKIMDILGVDALGLVVRGMWLIVCNPRDLRERWETREMREK
jgi:hypothetical protein